MNYTIYYKQLGIAEDGDYNHQHFHDDSIEIIQVLSGSGNITMGNRLGRFQEGDVYIIDSNVVHVTAPDAPQIYCRNKLLIDKMLLMRLTGKKIPPSLALNCTAEKFNRISDAFDSIQEKMNQQSSDLLIFSDVLKLLDVCLGDLDERFDTNKTLSTDVMDYVAKKLSDSLSLDSVAKAMHLSKYYLCHCFKKETGMTLGAYIHSMRFSLAKRLLISTDDPIASIAEAIGFNGAAAFSKSFMKENGMSPSAYRVAYRGDRIRP